MSYLHCHSCSWSQGDFYSFRYNPLTILYGHIKWLIFPRMIIFDRGFVDYEYVELKEYTKIPVKWFRVSECNSLEMSQYKCFSWNWLMLEISKDIRRLIGMKWWTFKSFKNAYNKGAVCPKCGNRNFDID